MNMYSISAELCVVSRKVVPFRGGLCTKADVNPLKLVRVAAPVCHPPTLGHKLCIR